MCGTLQASAWVTVAQLSRVQGLDESPHKKYQGEGNPSCLLIHQGKSSIKLSYLQWQELGMHNDWSGRTTHTITSYHVEGSQVHQRGLGSSNNYHDRWVWHRFVSLWLRKPLAYEWFGVSAFERSLVMQLGKHAVDCFGRMRNCTIEYVHGWKGWEGKCYPVSYVIARCNPFSRCTGWEDLLVALLLGSEVGHCWDSKR
jgi:hypothetical protein